MAIDWTDPSDATSETLENTVVSEPPSRVIDVPRREFMKLSVATGVLTILGCNKSPESNSAAPPAPESTAPESTSATSRQDVSPSVGQTAEQAAALGMNLEQIFNFVRDEISYEPYSGVLRGANGTLTGRAGNSADQAILLSALLTASGIRSRFSIGTLTDAKVRDLETASGADLVAARNHVVTAMTADAQRFRANAASAPSATFNGGSPDRYALSTSKIRQTATRQFEEAIGTIESGLAEVGVTAGTAWSGVPRLERARHVWVQAQSGDKWIDLDPSFPGSAPGDVHGSAHQTEDKLPDDMRHRVEFVAIAESWATGKLTQATIFEHSTFADELTGVPVCFTHVKPDDLKNLNLLGGKARGTRYHPALEVGPRVLVGNTPVVFGGGGGGSDAPGGTLVDALGGGETEGPPDGEAMAEWLEIRVTSPGEETKSAARTIFDRVWRYLRADGTADVSAVQPVELIDLPTATREYLPCRTIHAFSVASGAMSLSTLFQPASSAELGPLAMPAHGFHLVRDALVADIAIGLGVRIFLDSPCVTSLTIDSIAGSTELETRVSFDIWHRSSGVLPVLGQKAAHSPLMLAGVLTHVAERCVSLDGYSDDQGELENPTSVGAIFELSKSKNVPIRVLRKELPNSLSYSNQARTMIEHHLRLGAIVIVPERVPEDGLQIGWWLVDPISGWAIDCMDDGRGGSPYTEYGQSNMAVALRVLGCITALISVIATFVQYYAKKTGNLSAEEDEFLDRVQIATEAIGFVTGAGCVFGRRRWRRGPPPIDWHGVNRRALGDMFSRGRLR